MQINSSLKYNFIIITSTFLQGSSFVCTKILVQTIDPLWLAFIRFFLAAISLLPFIIYIQRKHNIIFRKIPWMKISIIGLLQTAGVMIFLNIGLVYTTASMSAIIMASNPLLVTILAFIFLKEKTSIIGITGLFISFTGVVICLNLSFSNFHISKGEFIVIIASTCWAISTLLSRKFNLSLSHWLITFYQMLIGSLIILFISLLKHTTFTLPTELNTWLALCWLIIPASTGAMGLWFLALKIGGAVQSSGYLFLCPFFSALISFILFNVKPTRHEIIGGILIGIGIFILAKFKNLKLGTQNTQTKIIKKI